MSGDERLLRVLERGGMLIDDGDGLAVYRRQDARRGCVGNLSRATFEQLKADGALVRQCGFEGRWVLRSGYQLTKNTDTGTAAPQFGRPLQTSQSKRASSVLEAALKTVEKQDKAWMARAAMRFLQDYEVQATGPSVTMNWSFEPGGQNRRRGHGLAGMPARSLAAQTVLRRIAEELGEMPFALLEAVLVKQHTQRRLCVDFAMAAPALLEAVRASLKQLAHTYDYCVRAEA